MLNFRQTLAFMRMKLSTSLAIMDISERKYEKWDKLLASHHLSYILLSFGLA